MQRLALAVILVAIVVVIAYVGARVVGRTLRSASLPAGGGGAVVPWRNGMTERIAYLVLLGVILGVSTGWLGEL